MRPPASSSSRRARSLVWIVAVAAAAASLTHATPAEARITREYTYTYDQLWTASIRLLAVDFRFPIVERDPAIGFLLFTYQERGRSFSGSLEMVRFEGVHGTPEVRVSVQVDDMPTYIERHLVERLTRKLTQDFGQAPAARPAPPPAREREDDDGQSDAEGGGDDAAPDEDA